MVFIPIDRFSIEPHFHAIALSFKSRDLESVNANFFERSFSRNLDIYASIGGITGKNPGRPERICLAKLEFADYPVPTGLGRRTPRMRPSGKIVLVTVVDCQLEEMFAGRQFPNRKTVDMRNGKGIARTDRFAVHLESRSPQNAFKEKFKRLSRHICGNVHLPRIRGRSYELMLKPQSITFLLVGNGVPRLVTLRLANTGIGKRPRQHRHRIDTIAGHLPRPSHIQCRKRQKRACESN